MYKKIKTTIYKQCNRGLSFLKTKWKQLDKYPVLQLLIYSLVIILVLEILSKRSIIKGLGFVIANPLMFLVNILIILFTLSLTLMFSRKNFLLVLITTLWLTLGVTNFVLLMFRTTPLAAMDFYLLKSVFGIIHIYLNTFQIIFILVLVAIVITAMIFLLIKMKKSQARLKMPIITLCVTAGLMLMLSNISLKVNALSTDFGNLADAYSDYGFAYCFSVSVFDRGIKKPEQYSEENIDEVIKKIENEPNQIGKKDEEPGKLDSKKPDESVAEEVNDIVDKSSLEIRPNIIMVQLESFFDVNQLLDYNFSENPIPNFTRLKKEFSYGYLTVPSIGAGTANTEFEIITGMSIKHFGPGEYPYRTILQTTTCESACYNLDELGYRSHAIHNNAATFYDRNVVFQKLGFDSFISIEYMNNVEYNPIGWAKDYVLTPEILKALEAQDARDFIYAISVQPHGKYPSSIVDQNQTIKVKVDPEKRQFINTNVEVDEWEENKPVKSSLVESGLGEHKSDETQSKVNGKDEIDIEISYKNAFEYFVNQLAETDKFIGELVEALSDYKEPTVVVFFGDHLPSFSLENEDLVNNNKFQTEYILWSNFPMKQVKRDLKAYQLNSYVMERLGYENGILTKFHQRYIDEPDYQDKLQLLQYDMLYGYKNVYKGENPYVEKPIQMGALEIVITDVKEKGEVIFIEGENFTPWSVIYINEEPKETLFIDEHTLIVPYEKLTDEGVYYVAQVSDTKIILSQSKEWK